MKEICFYDSETLEPDEGASAHLRKVVRAESVYHNAS